MNLKPKLLACVAVAAFSVSAPSLAASYNFNVLYSGGGEAGASLLAGDNPLASNLHAGDDFNWNIKAAGASFWNVDNGGGFFPLMALKMLESATRTGTYTFTLRNNASSVFSFSESSGQFAVHMGTNTATLSTGLQFDEMELNYSLTASTSFDNTPTTLMMFSGSPEGTTSFDGGRISYVPTAVPEPETYAMLIAGLGLLGALSRRRRQKETAAV